MALSGHIGLLGGGNMGAALLRGLLAAASARTDQVTVAEKDAARLTAATLVIKPGRRGYH